jgi:8-oxo-dGTP pyrophosphatase MutT (NUDIX family)
MIQNHRAPVTPIPASTVLLVRDGLLARDGGPGLEVLMVRRHHRIEFAGGKLVFPGGKINASDADPALAALCLNAEALAAEVMAAKVAGVREAFEETGFLLARDAKDRSPIAHSRLAALGRFRIELDRNRIGMAEFLSRHDLVLDLDDLAPFARWITSIDRPLRFDTWFYLAMAPTGQVAAHDGTEAVASSWIGLADATNETEALALGLMLPTWANLRRLAKSSSAAAALAQARATPVVTVLPWLDAEAPGGPMMRISDDAGYDIASYPPSVAPEG